MAFSFWRIREEGTGQLVRTVGATDPGVAERLANLYVSRHPGTYTVEE